MSVIIDESDKLVDCCSLENELDESNKYVDESDWLTFCKLSYEIITSKFCSFDWKKKEYIN